MRAFKLNKPENLIIYFNMLLGDNRASLLKIMLKMPVLLLFLATSTIPVKAYSFEYFWVFRILSNYQVIAEALAKICSPAHISNSAVTRMNLYPLSPGLMSGSSGMTNAVTPAAAPWGIDALMGIQWLRATPRNFNTRTISQKSGQRRFRYIVTSGDDSKSLWRSTPYCLNYDLSNGEAFSFRHYELRFSISYSSNVSWPLDTYGIGKLKASREDSASSDPEGIVIPPELSFELQRIFPEVNIQTEDRVSLSGLFQYIANDLTPWNWNTPSANEEIANLLVFLSQEEPIRAERNTYYSQLMGAYIVVCTSTNSILFLIPHRFTARSGLIPGADPDNERHLNPDLW